MLLHTCPPAQTVLHPPQVCGLTRFRQAPSQQRAKNLLGGWQTLPQLPQLRSSLVRSKQAFEQGVRPLGQVAQRGQGAQRLLAPLVGDDDDGDPRIRSDRPVRGNACPAEGAVAHALSAACDPRAWVLPQQQTRWTLSGLRAAWPAFWEYSLSGIWRILTQHKLHWKRGREHQPRAWTVVL